MTLVVPTTSPVSQRFAGQASAEFPGYFVNAADGRPLKAYKAAFPGSLYHAHFHRAIDLYGALGTPILAIEAGTVVFAGDDGAGGKLIRVMIQGHTDARYIADHCNSFSVSLGQKVAKGQVIAKMGKTGMADGVHDHFGIEFLESGRWMAYDPARFYPVHTFRYGTAYRADAIKYGWSDKDGYLIGGSHLYDDHIYPIRSITVNAGVNVRALPDTHAAVLLLTTAVTPASQLNEIPGGAYTLGGVTADTWAKVKLPAGVGYVAKPLIKA
jgi:murein DD-endopeptidase MepM/ murein hydrolase activator NlpD